jgi:Fur family peroxide stress response transcriptional regulator
MNRDAASLAGRMNDLVERCRNRGMSVTPQRMAIYRAVLEAEDHPSPETLYHRVRPRMPSLSLATIYKALDALVALGLVQEVGIVSETKRYDANLEQHHHLICTGCKKIIDFYDRGLDAVTPSRRLPGFVPQAISVQVTGLCGDCSKKQPRR